MAGFLSALLIISCTSTADQKNSENYMECYEEAVHKGDDETALYYLKKAAELNNPEALTRLGDAYLHGRYGLDDPEKALVLIKQAAEAGNARGMTDLGILYLNGTYIDQDYQTALSWFKKANEQGDMKAPRYLGLIYENGWGQEINFETAADYYIKAAENGDITGQYLLGRLYEQGLGVRQDYGEAYALYQKSAARGDIICLPAMMALGYMYEQGLGMNKDIEEALIWYKKAAALDDSSAKAKVAEYQYPENPFIMNITAIVTVIGDGQKVAAAAIEYKDPIDEDSLDLDDYRVEGRDIASVYVNDEAAVSLSGGTGCFVIIELETVIDKESAAMGGGPGKADGEEEDHPGFTGPQLGQVSDKPAEPVVLSVKLAQTGKVSTDGGLGIPSLKNEMESNRTVCRGIENFQQLVFHDEQFGKDLMYNLSVPENYDPSKSYPLVLFMHDAGAVSNNSIETLTQGLGAVIWASEEDQARHESFVLAPQYNAIMADDNSETSIDMDVTVDLIKALMDVYSIDADRLYNTGQSMGGMTSIAMDIKYPDLFAASLLVACQWDPALVTPLADKPLWIIVSEGDNKANPGMDALTSVLEEEGATIAKATWNAEADKAVLQMNVEDLLSRNASVNYTVFEGGSHRYTWQYAYSIEGIRDWLFSQHK